MNAGKEVSLKIVVYGFINSKKEVMFFSSRGKVLKSISKATNPGGQTFVLSLLM